MEKCKWSFKLFGHYIQYTEDCKFKVLGKRAENWKEVVCFKLPLTTIKINNKK